jgi:hypothetical protein
MYCVSHLFSRFFMGSFVCLLACLFNSYTVPASRGAMRGPIFSGCPGHVFYDVWLSYNQSAFNPNSNLMIQSHVSLDDLTRPCPSVLLAICRVRPDRFVKNP